MTVNSVFLNEGDWYWADSSIRTYIEQNKRLPETWHELRKYTKEIDKHYPVDNIENRVSINFPIFAKLNHSSWNIGDFDSDLLWAFRINKLKTNRTAMQLNEYCQLCISKNKINENIEDQAE